MCYHEAMFKGRGFYTSLIVVILLIVFGYPVFNFFNKEATCFDGKRNGNELGIDCGGGCQKVCEFSVQAPAILWSRSFEIRDGVYNSIAMVENSNVGIGALDVSYVFRLFDSNNILVYERKGRTNIPAQTRFPIFEGRIITGERIPQKTFFEFVGVIDWIKQETILSDLRIRDQKILNTDLAPRIEASIENRGLYPIENLEIFAIIYDMTDNAISGSNTFIESISPDSKQTVIFTWPEPFSAPIGRVEIVPKFATE